MRTPRDLSASDLEKALKGLGYEKTRQKGSHIRLTTNLDGVHHETIPNHDPIKIGTLSVILKSIANHHRMTVSELMEKLGL
jgi:predicted RNA binding protein YcfA (HicA-like mRNA interferase family)